MFLSSVYFIRNCKYEHDEEFEPELTEKSDEDELFEDDCRERARDMQESLK